MNWGAGDHYHDLQLVLIAFLAPKIYSQGYLIVYSIADYLQDRQKIILCVLQDPKPSNDRDRDMAEKRTSTFENRVIYSYQGLAKFFRFRALIFTHCQLSGFVLPFQRLLRAEVTVLRVESISIIK